MTRPRPSEDEFYEPIGAPPVPGPPGVVLRQRELESPVTPDVPVHQVVYGSRGARGQSTAVSGTILLPPGAWAGPGPRPILGYGVGLHGLHRDHAPSHLIALGTESEWPFIRLALRRGWAVAVTDGDGLGLPGPHTYGAGRPGGQAMLDLVRAALRLDLGLSHAAPVLLWGYSEGGRYAAWAAEHQPSYAPDLRLVGVAAGGVPADLYAVARAIDGGAHSGLGLAVLVGLAQAHRDRRLWDILTPAGRRAADRAAGLDAAGVIAAFPEPMERFTVRTSPWDEPVWRSLLEAERLGRCGPAVPTYHYHARRDEIVPLRVAQDLVTRYRARGADPAWVVLDAANHLGGAVLGAAGAVRWLQHRLAATTLPSAAQGPGAGNDADGLDQVDRAS